MDNMQVWCPYYAKDHRESNVTLTGVWYFELNESIIKQLIKHLFHTFWLLFRFKSKCGRPISSNITYA